MPHLDHFPRPGEFDAYRPYWLIWCPIGWLVGGCGARAVSRKTPIYYSVILDIAAAAAAR